MKISDGFKFEIGQFLARLAVSASILAGIAVCFALALFFNYLFG